MSYQDLVIPETVEPMVPAAGTARRFSQVLREGGDNRLHFTHTTPDFLRGEDHSPQEFNAYIEFGTLRVTNGALRLNYNDQGAPNALVVQLRLTPEWVDLGRYDGDREQSLKVTDADFWPKPLEGSEPSDAVVTQHIYTQVWMRPESQAGSSAAAEELKEHYRKATPLLQALVDSGMRSIRGASNQRGRSTRDSHRIAIPQGTHPRNAGAVVDQAVIQINPAYRAGFDGDWLTETLHNIWLAHPDREGKMPMSLTGVTREKQAIGSGPNVDQVHLPNYADLASITIGGEEYNLSPVSDEFTESTSLLAELDKAAGSAPAERPQQGRQPRQQVAQPSSERVGSVEEAAAFLGFDDN